MAIKHLSNTEIALRLAKAIRAWRISPDGAGISQVDLAQKSGIGLTPLKRFEKTGAITLRNLVALLRALDLLDGLDTLIPDATDLGPLAQLNVQEERLRKEQRTRAPRTKRNTKEY